MKKLLVFVPIILLLAGCGQESKCQEMVKDQLRSPSTAVFSKMETYKTDIFGDVVGGFVESQNRFGAMVGDKFYCINVAGDDFVIFREGDFEIYDEVTNAINNSDKPLKDKIECEKAIQKVLKDSSIKIIGYIGDEDEDSSFRLNGGVIEYKGGYENILCYVDDKKGGVYQLRIGDRIHKVSENDNTSEKVTNDKSKNQTEDINGFKTIEPL